eukprot:9951553-Lingulodinium_polyedra.AAC.1
MGRRGEEGQLPPCQGLWQDVGAVFGLWLRALLAAARRRPAFAGQTLLVLVQDEGSPNTAVYCI